MYAPKVVISCYSGLDLLPDQISKEEIKQWIYSVSQKKLPPPHDFCQFLPNGWEFLIEILHTYYAFKYTIDCQILSNYLQILQSYAINDFRKHLNACVAADGGHFEHTM